MKLDLTEIIEKLKVIEHDFNRSKDPTEKYALIQALNHVGEVDIPIHGYTEDLFRNAMLKEHGVNVRQTTYKGVDV